MDLNQRYELKISGRAYPSEWHEKTYALLLRVRVDERHIVTSTFGCAHRAPAYPAEPSRQATGKAWVVRTEDGEVFVGPGSGPQNDSRDMALYLAEKKLNEVGPR